jgi:hypothetical protein
MADKRRSGVRRSSRIAASVVFLAAWIAGGVWYFGFDHDRDRCASLRYQDDAAYDDCEHAQAGR